MKIFTIPAKRIQHVRDGFSLQVIRIESFVIGEIVEVNAFGGDQFFPQSFFKNLKSGNEKVTAVANSRGFCECFHNSLLSEEYLKKEVKEQITERKVTAAQNRQINFSGFLRNRIYNLFVINDLEIAFVFESFLKRIPFWNKKRTLSSALRWYRQSLDLQHYIIRSGM